MDKKEPFKNKPDKLKDVKSDDTSQINISTNNPNPRGEEKEISESEMDKSDDKPGSKVKRDELGSYVKKEEPDSKLGEDETGSGVKKDDPESKPGEEHPGSRLKKDQPRSKVKSADSEKKPGCKEELPLTSASKTTEDEQNTEEANEAVKLYRSGSFLGSSYARSDKSIATPKSSKGLLQKNTSVDSSENSSETTDSGTFSREIQNRKGSDPGTSPTSNPSDSSKSRTENSPNDEESGLESLPKTSPRNESEDSSKSSTGSLVPKSESITTNSSEGEGPLVLEDNHPNPVPPPGDIPRDLPSDALDRDKIDPPPPPEIPKEDNPNPRPSSNPESPPDEVEEESTGSTARNSCPWNSWSWKVKVYFILAIIGLTSLHMIALYFMIIGINEANNTTSTNETFTNATFIDETFTNATFIDETFNNATFIDETFTNATFTTETFTNATNH